MTDPHLEHLQRHVDAAKDMCLHALRIILREEQQCQSSDRTVNLVDAEDIAEARRSVALYVFHCQLLRQHELRQATTYTDPQPRPSLCGGMVP